MDAHTHLREAKIVTHHTGDFKTFQRGSTPGYLRHQTQTPAEIQRLITAQTLNE